MTIILPSIELPPHLIYSEIADSWTVGLLDSWTVGLLDCWTVGLLDSWTVGLLVC